MIDRDHPGPGERGRLTEQDLAIAALVGSYIERREHHQATRALAPSTPPREELCHAQASA